MKKIWSLAFLLLLIILPVSVLAQEDFTVVELNSVGIGTYFYSHTFDNLVLDFTVQPAIIDVLETFTVRNAGTARSGSEISAMLLYRDNGDGVFQGFGIDEHLDTASYDFTNSQWVFEALNQVIVLDGERFFVTVELAGGGTANRTMQFYIPSFLDLNENLAYDAGDAGIFMLSEFPLPGSDLISDSISWYREQSGDVFSPTVVATNITDGKIFENVSSYTINGRARDAGITALEKVQVCIDGDCRDVQSLSSEFNSWSYNWQFEGAGTYELTFKGIDGAGNITQTEPISVTVNLETFISYKTTEIVFDKQKPLGNAIDRLTIDVYIRDQFNNPVVDQLVEISVDNQGVIVDRSYGYSDDNGLVQFLSWSAKVGEVNYSFYINGAHYNADFPIEFVTGLPEIDYEVGRFVKLSDQSAVYFLDINNIRHTYPTQKVWESYFGKDFSMVETISNQEMAGYLLGRNVPFKKGTLMKIPSVPKVYEIGNGGVMHWVPTAEIAVDLYGADWAKKVNDLPESFFTDYTEGLTK